MRRNVALSLRCLVPADLAAVEAILVANRPVFSDTECVTAMDLVREGLAAADDDDAYQILVADDGGRVVGYTCFGSIPLTSGAFDLYWIAVAPDHHAHGVGRALLRRTEEIVAAQGGRLVVVETSSRPDYDRTRRFYEHTAGYETGARLRDFYKPGEDKVVYVKYLGPAQAVRIE